MNKFLNKHEPIYETAGNLPHWTQYGKITFVTFRLVDSLPQDVIDNIKTEYESIKQRLLKEGCQKELELLKAKRHNQLEKYLDKGYGSCLLKTKQYRDIIIQTLEHDNNIMYELHSYVIMPNHIHLLVEPIGQATIQQITQTIKSVSAHKINNYTNLTGSIWQKEYFDRIIRNEDHYNRVINYIRQNPSHCSPSEYTHWERGRPVPE